MDKEKIMRILNRAKEVGAIREKVYWLLRKELEK